MPKSSYEEFISNPKRRKLFEKEALVIEATELICKLMENRGVSKAELSRRENTTKAAITQLFRDSRNISLKKLASLAYSLGYRIKLSYEKLEKVKA